MINLAAFLLAAFPLCEGTIDQHACARHIANECVMEQFVAPFEDAEYCIENEIEKLSPEWWPDEDVDDTSSTAR